MNKLLSFVAGFVTFTVLDYIWLAHVAKSFYLGRLGQLATVSNGSLVPYLPAVPVVYIVGISALYYFVVRKATSVTEALVVGGIFGGAMYAFYDFTNLATLRGYGFDIAVVDTLWGIIVCALVSTCMYVVLWRGQSRSEIQSETE